MQLFEEVYTSAPDLLDGVGGHLGVVARSVGFPRAVSRELEARQSYTPLGGAASTAVLSRIVVGPCGPGGAYLGLSRSLRAGVDHTGRDRPFTHHIVVSHAELQEAGADCALVVGSVDPAWLARWEGAPRWIDPPRQLAAARTLIPSRAWIQPPASDDRMSRLCMAAGALVRFGSSRRPLVVVLQVELAEETAACIADCLSLIPPSIQRTLLCVSHVVDAADFLRDAALAVTYPATPFLTQSQSRQDPRRPRILDLGTASCDAEFADPYSEVLIQAWESGGLEAARKVGRKWDAWGMRPGDQEIFARLVDFQARLSGVRSDQVSQLASSVGPLIGHPAAGERVVHWLSQWVEHVRQRPTPEGCSALIQYYIDPRWPEGTRREALAALRAQPFETLENCLALADVGPSREAAQQLLQALFQHAGWASHVFSTAASSTSPGSRERQVAQAVCAWLPQSPELIQSLLRVGRSDRELRLGLLDAAGRVASQTRDLDPWVSLAKELSASDPSFGQDVCERLLRPRLAAAGATPLDSTAQALWDVASRCDDVEGERQWLEANGLFSRLSPRLQAQWRPTAAPVSERQSAWTPDVEPQDDLLGSNLVRRPRGYWLIRPMRPLCAFLALGILTVYLAVFGIGRLPDGPTGFAMAVGLSWLTFEGVAIAFLNTRWRLAIGLRAVFLPLLAITLGVLVVMERNPLWRAVADFQKTLSSQRLESN